MHLLMLLSMMYLTRFRKMPDTTDDYRIKDLTEQLSVAENDLRHAKRESSDLRANNRKLQEKYNNVVRLNGGWKLRSEEDARQIAALREENESLKKSLSQITTTNRNLLNCEAKLAEANEVIRRLKLETADRGVA